MTPRPADRDPVDAVALLRHADRVEPATGGSHRRPAAFAEGARRPQRLRPMLDQPGGAAKPARLLVRGAREQDVPPEPRDRSVAGSRPAARASAARRSEQHPAPTRPCPSCRPRRVPTCTPRRCRPRTGRALQRSAGAGTTSRWLEEQERLAAGAVASRVRARPSRGRAPAPALGHDPDVGQPVGDRARRDRAPAPGGSGWVDRGDADEVDEVAEERLVRVVPGRRVEAGGRQTGRGGGHARIQRTRTRRPRPTRGRSDPTSAPRMPRTKPIRTMVIAMPTRSRVSRRLARQRLGELGVVTAGDVRRFEAATAGGDVARG